MFLPGAIIMIAQELRAALTATPFRPFTARMADGRTFEIQHPDFLLLGPNGRTAFAFANTGGEFSILDVMLMTELDFSRSESQSATDR
jgi:hypothetical protein